MPGIDFGVLDTVISVVVVILLLSMVVQSVQTFLKKIFKFKSRQIQKSLANLFDYVATSAPAENAATAQKVMTHFQDLGRTTAIGGHAIESISKADLAKVVTSIEGSSRVPEQMKSAVQTFSDALTEARRAVEAVSKVRLTPESVATFTKLRGALAPMAAHVSTLFQGDTLDPRLLVKDVMTFRDFDTAAVLKLVTDLQSQLDQAVASDPNNAELQAAAKAAHDLASALANVHARLLQLIAPVRERLSAIDSWYDTVMLGFQERYARHMRTWAFLISLALTVFLNADIFAIYKRLATSDVQQQRVMREAEAIENRYQTLINAQTNPETIQQLNAELEQQLDAAAMSFPAMGIEPMQSFDELKNTTGWQIAGWLVMAALLSLGAPFWHDTLESLFGLKNFLRDKSNTQKVEQASGAGLTRT
jgi:hypothetical protein